MDDFMSDNNDGGTFVKWETPGDEVFGVVVSFSLDGGTDFAGHPAPKLVVQRMRRTGESWYEVEATGDDDAVVNGGPSALQNLLREKAYKFQPGYLVRFANRCQVSAQRGHFDLPHLVSQVCADCVRVSRESLQACPVAP